jgi:hypothetical protein
MQNTPKLMLNYYCAIFLIEPAELAATIQLICVLFIDLYQSNGKGTPPPSCDLPLHHLPRALRPPLVAGRPSTSASPSFFGSPLASTRPPHRPRPPASEAARPVRWQCPRPPLASATATATTVNLLPFRLIHLAR